MLFMRLGGRRIEYQADVLVDIGATQALQSFMGSEYSEAASAASPSESGSTPTMAPIWSALPWRMTLIIKSVPMFPDPMIATFNCCIYLSFQRVIVPAARSCCSAEANADGADIGDFGFVLLILLPSDHRPQCSGQYDIARSERFTGAS